MQSAGSEFDTDGRYQQFIADFQSRTLPKPRWTHHAHLALALWYLHRWPPHHALQRIRADICAYNESVGTANTDSGGYHETLTQLYLRGVRAHHREHAVPLLQSLRLLLESPLASSTWPLRFYSKALLWSTAARRAWVEPDLDAQRAWNDSDDSAFSLESGARMKRHISSGSTFEQQIGYSRAVVEDGWVFVSGTTGFDYASMRIEDDVVAQAEQTLRNIDTALREAGASLDDVVRVRYILPDAGDFEACWPALRRAFHVARPAATMISAGLADPRMKIEIEVTARLRAGA